MFLIPWSATFVATVNDLYIVVERRRRDKINNWIVQLSKLVPDCAIDLSKQGQISKVPANLLSLQGVSVLDSVLVVMFSHTKLEFYLCLGNIKMLHILAQLFAQI